MEREKQKWWNAHITTNTLNYFKKAKNKQTSYKQSFPCHTWIIKDHVRMSFTFILIQSIRFQKLRKTKLSIIKKKKKVSLAYEQAFNSWWASFIRTMFLNNMVLQLASMALCNSCYMTLVHKCCIYQISVAWKCYSRHWLSIQIKIKHTCWCSWISGVSHKARQSQVATKISGQA